MIKQHKINNQIRAVKVRVVDKDGTNLGILAVTEALDKSRQEGLDLVMITESANPPVCKIIDYNKYLYDQKSKEKKSKQRKTDLKEFILTPKIGEGDMKVRIERGREFIKDGHIVKYTVKFKGREMSYPEIGETKLKIVTSELSDIAEIEKAPQIVGNTMSMTLMPKKNN